MEFQRFSTLRSHFGEGISPTRQLAYQKSTGTTWAAKVRCEPGLSNDRCDQRGPGTEEVKVVLAFPLNRFQGGRAFQ